MPIARTSGLCQHRADGRERCLASLVHDGLLVQVADDAYALP